MRYIFYLFLLALIAFGLYPYYVTFMSLDKAIEKQDTSLAATLFDSAQISNNRATRAERNATRARQQASEDDQNLTLESQPQTDFTLDAGLSDLASKIKTSTNRERAMLSSTVKFANFENWDKFIIRIGELGEQPVFIRMTLEKDGNESIWSYRWRVTDIID